MSATLTAQAIQRGRGKGRDPWLIRRALANLNPPVTPSGIARELGLSPQTVSQVIRGVTTSSNIDNALIAKGCPPELLYCEKNRGGKAA